MSDCEPWPCSTCGAAGVRNVYAAGYCGAHLNELYRTFRPEVWGGLGIGLQAGPRRPDFGPEYVDVECSACGATWIGPLFEACPWCADALERMRQRQAVLLLNAELPDPADVRYDGAVKAWGERLARGVDAGLISEHEARQVLHHRGVRRVAA